MDIQDELDRLNVQIYEYEHSLKIQLAADCERVKKLIDEYKLITNFKSAINAYLCVISKGGK